MKKYLWLFGLVAIAATTFPKMSAAACAVENIVIDGDYADWADCEILVTDNNGEASNLQYWDTTGGDDGTGAWTLTDPGYDTWTFDDAAMLDISEFKMLNDSQFVYFYMQNSWPMMALQAPDGIYYGMWVLSMPAEFRDPALDNYEFLPTTAPDFDHWMVWGFDKDLDDIYDYYFGAHLDVSSMTGENEEDSENGPGLSVYQDDGDGSFDPELDTKLANIDTNDGHTSMDNAGETNTISSLKFEIKQNIETFYEVTGIAAGDTVKVRMETRSEIGDTTAGKRYTFALGVPQNVRVTNITSTTATVKWNKVDSAHHYQLALYSKKGKKISTIKVMKTSETLNDLASKTVYKVRLRAVNKAGVKGPWSSYKKFTTK